ncbi:MAG: PEP-CTERM sorting domain-containing protein [Opitutales bacterium]
MKASITRIAILAGLAFSTTAINAEIVNFNMLRLSSEDATVTSPGYGLWDQGTEVWNTTNESSATNLVDSTGAATTIGFSTTNFGGRNLNASWGPDLLTSQGAFSANDDTTIGQVTISGLTAETPYDIIFYFAANNRNELQTANGINPVAFTGSTTTTGNTTYIDASTVDITSTGAQFWYFDGILPNASNEIVMTISGPGFETFTGFQIASIPEPGTFALLAGILGLTWVMVRRRA